jgi:hypothetical protein
MGVFDVVLLEEWKKKIKEKFSMSVKNFASRVEPNHHSCCLPLFQTPKRHSGNSLLLLLIAFSAIALYSI